MTNARNPECDPVRFKNTILSHLAPDSIERLDLAPIALPEGRSMERNRSAVKKLYFIEKGVGCMTTVFADGSEAEVSMFGCESVIGVSGLMGSKRSVNRIYMQIAGRGFSCSIENARKEFHLCGNFQQLCLRYVQTQ